MAKVSNFRKDLREGEEAERWVADFLLLSGMASEVEQSKGMFTEYDLLCKRENKKPFTIEVKYDMRSADTGNFFFELVSNTAYENLGAGLSSNSDYLALVTPDGEDIIRIILTPFAKIKAHAMVALLQEKYRITSVKDNDRCIGILIPIQKILDICSDYVIYYNKQRKEIISHERKKPIRLV